MWNAFQKAYSLAMGAQGGRDSGSSASRTASFAKAVFFLDLAACRKRYYDEYSIWSTQRTLLEWSAALRTFIETLENGRPSPAPFLTFTDPTVVIQPRRRPRRLYVCIRYFALRFYQYLKVVQLAGSSSGDQCNRRQEYASVSYQLSRVP